MLVRTMTEEEIHDIGHAFRYYDYGQGEALARHGFMNCIGGERDEDGRK